MVYGLGFAQELLRYARCAPTLNCPVRVTQTHVVSLVLSLCRSLSRARALSLSLSLPLVLSRSLSLSLAFSLSLSRACAHSLALSLSLADSLSLVLCLSQVIVEERQAGLEYLLASQLVQRFWV